VISTDRAHPALISDADFLAAQTVTALAVPKDQAERRNPLHPDKPATGAGKPDAHNALLTHTV
jgi:hypothetical protein